MNDAKNEANARQQIVDSIKNNNNVLVTVSTNPSVDELSAALGLTILLNNLGKRGTAVVSGQIPPAINFLEPEKTFENTTDSLRDFIIALDKEKADHLRYKVDGDVVKIFITPYRTQLSETDLEFSLGDFNVEVVIALGVKDQAHLDKALDAQGAILHDATILTLTAGENVSTLGSINWQDQTASSICEMLVSISEALKGDKPLLDEQTSTALLTGIVAATDRFSNDHTTSRVMTMAAQLMAAGANQQLIAAKLVEGHEIGTDSVPAGSVEPSAANVATPGATASTPENGLVIEHTAPVEQPADVQAAAPQLPQLPTVETVPAEAAPATVPAPEPVAAAAAVAAAPVAETAEETLARELAEVVPAPAEAPTQELSEAEVLEEGTQPVPDLTAAPVPEPPALDFASMLPQTPPVEEPAAEVAPPPVPSLELPSLPQAEPAGSTDITTHAADNGYVAPPEAAGSVAESDPEASVDPFAAPLASASLPPLQPDPLFAAQQTSSAPIAQTINPPSEMPDQIDYEESPISSDPAAAAAVPDFAATNPTGLAAAPPSLDNLPALPELPPLPDLSSPPPPPDLSLPATPAPATAAAATPPPPGQFMIPGQ